MTEAHTTKPQISPFGWLAILLAAAGLGCLIYFDITQIHVGHGEHSADEAALPPLWGIGALPFLILLTCIAVLPLLPVVYRWWESNLNRLVAALICANSTLVYYLLRQRLGGGPADAESRGAGRVPALHRAALQSLRDPPAGSRWRATWRRIPAPMRDSSPSVR